LAIDAVMRPRSAHGAIAWSIALICIPTITIPIYLVFGRTKFRGYAESVREKEEQLDQGIPGWYRRMDALGAEPCGGLDRIETVIRRLTNVPFTRANRVGLLIDADATYGAMIDAIAGAESYVLVQFYIVRDDDSGRAIRDALIERARAGVRVYFLYDEIGSIKLRAAYLDAMRRESIDVSGFRTTQGALNRLQINFRNHRKLMVVDGRTGFIGGLNLGDEYRTFRDTHLKIDGPAAQQIQLTFRKDWYWATRQIIDVDDEPALTDDRGQAVSIVNTGPADVVPKCSILFSQLVAAAVRRIWIASPYFVPDDVMTRSLQAAAQRGVDVRVLMPDEPDQRFVELASLTYYSEMINCGVRLFRYRGRFMHHKVMLVDDELAAVGTVNLDYRSLYVNFEETALVADADFARQVEGMLTQDLMHCQGSRARPFRTRARSHPRASSHCPSRVALALRPRTRRAELVSNLMMSHGPGATASRNPNLGHSGRDGYPTQQKRLREALRERPQHLLFGRRLLGELEYDASPTTALAESEPASWATTGRFHSRRQARTRPASSRACSNAMPTSSRPAVAPIHRCLKVRWFTTAAAVGPITTTPTSSTRQSTRSRWAPRSSTRATSPTSPRKTFGTRPYSLRRCSSESTQPKRPSRLAFSLFEAFPSCPSAPCIS
jgi:cardiolipin synthase